MAKRSLRSHGEFFLSYLTAGVSVLDCGCGPGSITLEIARAVRPGRVVGVDFGPTQIEQAAARTKSQAVENLTFEVADCYALPFESDSFDRIFSHALLEHLADPVRALTAMYRTLKPGGVIGICSPDWSGFILSPPSLELSRAVEAYTTLQSKNGGDVGAGRKLGLHLAAAGFQGVRMSARYECYPSLRFIGEYLALQLEREGDARSAQTLRAWSANEDGLFAQAWVSAVARKNT